MARRNPRRNISRIEKSAADGAIIGGWEVRLQRRKLKFNQYFADSVHGGKNAALRAAKAYRDQLEVAEPAMTVSDRAAIPSSRNRSGVVGVRLHHQKSQHGDFEYSYWFWVAQWVDGRGRRKSKSFSIDKYGDREAFRLAKQARIEGTRRAKR